MCELKETPFSTPSNPAVSEQTPPFSPQHTNAKENLKSHFLFCFPVFFFFFFLMCWVFQATNPKNVSGNKALQNFLASIQSQKSFLTSQ